MPPDVALPEELRPLAEALDQAQALVDQVSITREALETKVLLPNNMAFSLLLVVTGSDEDTFCLQNSMRQQAQDSLSWPAT